MKVQSFFARRPVFTYDELATFLASRGERSPRTTSSLLNYHVRAGHLLRVRRGLYAVVAAGTRPTDQPIDRYLVAARMAPDAVIAYHTALEFHGKAYSVHERSVFCTGHRVRSLTLRGHRYQGLLHPKALRDHGQEAAGVEIKDRAGLDVRVTRLERSMVDVLDRPDLGGGWEEVWRSLEMIEYFDLDAVVEYALLLDNATTSAKVGLYLTQHREALGADDRVLERLRRHRPRQPHYVERGTREQGRLVSDWNLVVPEALLHRGWEEVA